MIARLNAEIQNQRDQFEANNQLVVAQANANWRQTIATTEFADTAAANMELAKTTNALTGAALDQLWQRERDLMEYSWQSSEKTMDRAVSILLGDKTLEGIRAQLDAEEDAAKTNFVMKLLFGGLGIL